MAVTIAHETCCHFVYGLTTANAHADVGITECMVTLTGFSVGIVLEVVFWHFRPIHNL